MSKYIYQESNISTIIVNRKQEDVAVVRYTLKRNASSRLGRSGASRMSSGRWVCLYDLRIDVHGCPAGRARRLAATR